MNQKTPHIVKQNPVKNAVLIKDLNVLFWYHGYDLTPFESGPLLWIPIVEPTVDVTWVTPSTVPLKTLPIKLPSFLSFSSSRS